jgi:hypothetical protein
VVGGARDEVLDVPGRVRDGSCWFGPRGSETYQLQHVLGVEGSLIDGWMSSVVVEHRGEKGSKRRSGENSRSGGWPWNTAPPWRRTYLVSRELRGHRRSSPTVFSLLFLG